MRLFRIVMIVLLLLAILFLVGPRIEINTTIEPLQIPEDIELYLSETEQRFPDLKPGTKKAIIWANPAQKVETPVAVVYLHGFSATRHEVAPLSELVAAQLGGNLYYGRLTGHGRSDDAMAEATVNAWINDAVEAVAIGERLGEEVVLIASSTGATLFTWLAANGHLSPEISALILLSPNFGPANPTSEILLWPWGEQIVRLVQGPYREWEPVNDQHAEFWTFRYPVAALLPVMGTVKLVRESDLATVQQPLLMLYTTRDTSVNPQKIEAAFGQFGSQPKELMAVTTEHAGGHVLAGDILSPSTTEPLAQTIVNFLIPILDAPES